MASGSTADGTVGSRWRALVGPALGLMAMLAALAAAATAWLMVTRPVQVAERLNERGVSALAELLAGALVEAFKIIVEYL